MRKHKNKIISGVVIFCVLVLVYWWGGNAPGLRGWNVTNTTKTEQNVSDIPIKEADEEIAKEAKIQKKDNTPMTAEEKTELARQIAQSAATDAESKNENQNDNQVNLDKDEYNTEPTPEGKPAPIEPQNAVISDKALTCTLSVRCDAILNNLEWLDEEKAELVPKDGIIYVEKTVTFYEGESVFNLLLREMKQNKIHMEFVNPPIYNSAYIEGIGNIYEFDCGELSGWMYKVNDWFPNYGSSRYQLKAGDKVEWIYTCDLGVDIGGYYSSGNGMR